MTNGEVNAIAVLFELLLFGGWMETQMRKGIHGVLLCSSEEFNMLRKCELYRRYFDWDGWHTHQKTFIQ